jgi:hypothetical protein
MNSDVTPFIEAERLLRKYGYDWHADHVAECCGKISTEGSSAYQHIATGEWWGGAGSIADVYLIGPGGTPSEEKPDNRKLRSALIRIHDLMMVNGVTLDRAALWADTFREWERKGV